MSFCPFLCWRRALLHALAAVHLSLCALPMDVPEHASDSSLTALLQHRIGRSSQAQLEWAVAKQGRDGRLGRSCLKSAVLRPMGATLKVKMLNTYS